jgi:hypothetical protein
MPNLQAVSRERHADKRWQRYSSYVFAEKDAVCPLVAQELPKAMMCMPVGFTQAGEGFTLVAIQGLAPGECLLVDGAGKWLTEYTPAHYRGYPFALASSTDGQRVLCIDEDSGLVDQHVGEAFFGDDGAPAQAVADVLDFLSQLANNAQATQRICNVLQEHGLIQPWPIAVQNDAGDQKVGGLFRIDEVALNALPAEGLAALRSAGALPIAYCQLLSMQHLGRLGKLSQARRQAAAAAMTAPALGETFSFAGLS